MGNDVATSGGDEPLPRNLSKLARIANREHLKATAMATGAVEHAVVAGEALAKARELCDSRAWADLIDNEFQGSLRTAQRYMRLARNFRLIKQRSPHLAITSQSEAAKALTTIMKGDATPSTGGRSKNTRHACRKAEKLDGVPLVARTIELLAELRRQLSDLTPVGYLVRKAIDMISQGEADLTALIQAPGDISLESGNPPTTTQSEGSSDAAY